MYKNKKQWGQKRSPCCPPKMSVRNRRKKSCVRPTECHCLSACCFCARSYIDVTSYQSKAGQFHLNSIKWSLSYMYLQYKHFIQGQNVFHEKLIKKMCSSLCKHWPLFTSVRQKKIHFGWKEQGLMTYSWQVVGGVFHVVGLLVTKYLSHPFSL